MGRSRRKYKQSRTKVRVGLPKKNPRIFKPAFSVPPKLLQSVVDSDLNPEWDDKGSVNHNYNSFGVVSNPNSLTIRNTPQSDSHSDSGSDLEEDDLKSALGKKRRDGKTAPPKPLTAMQRVHISRLVDKYGDDYQSMFMDIKLNPMQHSLATLEKLCKRYHMHSNKNPLILTK
ncbi:nucleolar protein 16 [Gastrolobium bilobum]|uniref:nucleolar protein 16 n=1 Tax=Gastrolobium bilobum TaxID=150636 RepID=UPI002AB0F7E4|nr:nucleolar protein 16 [Gastrolobium bilobum]